MISILRKGRIFNPDSFNDGFTYGANPLPIVLDKETVRFLFNRRDSNNRSSVFSLDFKIDQNSFTSAYEIQKLLAPGEVGLFDDAGASVGSLFQLDSKTYLFYYMGWNLGVTVPWRNSIGVANYDIVENEILKLRKSPVLDRSEEDPYTLSYPWVLKENDSFVMFYGSNQSWNTSKVDIDHVLKRTYSKDGIHWGNREKVRFQYPENANAFCRPSIIKFNGNFIMAYAYRNDKYKIGFLFSTDLENWSTLGFFEPDLENEWESHEVTYPALFEFNGKCYFSYCGNGYGKSGFGLAEISFKDVK